MTSPQTISNPDQAVEALQQLDVDNQLASLWYLYLDMKNQLSPAEGDPSGFNVSEALYDQVTQMSAEQQLQVQRDIAAKAVTDITKTYGDYSSSGKLFFWLRLAQGMEDGSIVTVPSDFQMSADAKNLLNALQSMDMEQQTTFSRNAVQSMGAT